MRTLLFKAADAHFSGTVRISQTVICNFLVSLSFALRFNAENFASSSVQGLTSSALRSSCFAPGNRAIRQLSWSVLLLSHFYLRFSFRQVPVPR